MEWSTSTQQQSQEDLMPKELSIYYTLHALSISIYCSKFIEYQGRLTITREQRKSCSYHTSAHACCRHCWRRINLICIRKIVQERRKDNTKSETKRNTSKHGYNPVNVRTSCPGLPEKGWTVNDAPKTGNREAAVLGTDYAGRVRTGKAVDVLIPAHGDSAG